MQYRLKIYNGGGSEVYHTIIDREDENEAIKQLLDEVYINAGDKIEIEDNYDD